jgi:hypothetical protein
MDRFISAVIMWAGQVEFFSDFSSEKSIETVRWVFPRAWSRYITHSVPLDLTLALFCSLIAAIKRSNSNQ